MPDSPAGVYTLPPSYKVNNGDTSDASQHNPPFEDIAAALTERLCRDGRTSWTGDQNANGYKLTGLSDGTDPADAATVGQIAYLGVPVGSIIDYAGSSAPDGWLLCNGQAVSRSLFPDLFAAIGTTYGIGDGSTTFNVPDLRGRVIAGLDDMGTTAANRITNAGSGIAGTQLGASGGSETHTLTVSQMPKHSHTATASSAGAHGHQLYIRGGGANTSGSSGGIMVEGAGTAYGPNTGSVGGTNGNQIGGAADHTHTITVADAGSNAAHPNVQPTMVMNKIIKAA